MKKITSLSFLLLTIIFCFSAQAQSWLETIPTATNNTGTWATKTPIPTKRYLFACETVNGKIYAIGGYNGGYFTTNEEYDPATDTWTTKASMSQAREGAASGVVNGKIYVFGGNTGGPFYKNVEEYDPGRNTWTSKTDIPGYFLQGACAAVNGKIYVIGGYDLAYIDTVREYDPATDSWTTKTSMPTARNYTTASVVNNKIYVFGGYDGTNELSTVEEYNTATDTWTTKSSMPTVRIGQLSVAVNGKIYCIGGLTAGVFSNEVLEYDPATDTWLNCGGSCTTMPTARLFLNGSVVNSKIYAISGQIQGAGYTMTNAVEEYTPPDVDTAPALPTGLTATPGNQQVTLRWSPNTESNLQKYNIYRDTSSPATTFIHSIVGSPPDTFYTDTGLTNGQIYYYRITAVDNAGNESGYSDEVSAIPNPVTIYVSTSGNDSNSGTASNPLRNIQTALSRANSGGTIKVAEGTYEEGLIPQNPVVLLGGYTGNFSESERHRFNHKTIVQAVSATILTDNKGCTVDGFVFDGNSVCDLGIKLTDGSVFTHNLVWRVNAFAAHSMETNGGAVVVNNTIVESGYGLDIYSGSGTPVFKNNIIAHTNFGVNTIGYSSAVRSYNNVFGNTYNYVGFDDTPGIGDISLNPQFVDRDNGDFRLQESSPCIDRGDPDVQYNDPDGSRNDIGVYYYFGEAPSAPTGLAASPGDQQVILRWSPNTESDLHKYNIYRDISSPATTLIVSVVGSPPDTFYTDTGLTNGQIYYYRITAVDNAGNESGYSTEVSATPTALGPTEVSGIISSNTTWKFAGSPYIVVGSILVSEGVTLTIEPGVTVRFDSNKALQIDGTLIARGTSSNNITFTANQSEQVAGDWGYILFSNSSIDATYDFDGNYTDGSILEHCIVEYAGGASVSGNGAVRIDNAHPFINYCTIRNNSASGIGAYGLSETLKITNNTISNNTAETHGGGIDVANGQVTISNNIIRNNRAINGGGIHVVWVQATISSNVISNNTVNGWGGGIYTNDVSKISNNTICNNAASCGGGIFVANGQVTISNNIIRNNSADSGGGIKAGTGTTISNNSILRNSAPNCSAVDYQGNQEFQNNTLKENIATGDAPTYTIYVRSNPLFNYNNIFNNSATYELWNGNAQGSADVDATNNWWGTATESDIEAKIYHWVDDSDKGLVDYTPYETSIRTDAPISPPNGLKATEGTGNITLNWSANTEGDLAGYKVYWDTDSEYPYANVVDVGNVTSYNITGLALGTYYVTVTSYDNDYNSANDDPATIVNDNQTNGNESWYAEEINVTPGTAPIVTTETATNINTNSATLNGTVNPNGLSTTVIFEYGKTASYGGQITADQSPVSGTTDVTVSANLTGLTENTEYHFRVVATNSKGTTNGVDLTFTTLQAGSAPTTTTNAATDVNTTSATLNGTVNPNELSTTVTFEFGETTGYGNQVTANQSPVSGTTDVTVSVNLSGLTDNTEYHYRVVATNSAGTTNGTDLTFTTLQAGSAPTTTTDVATDVNTTSATLNGTVNPNELSTTVIFEWGETTSYGSQITAYQSPVSGTSSVAVSADLFGLSENTEYHYRVVATNSKGTINGNDQTFTTLISYPSTYKLNTSISFPNRTNASDYRSTDYRIVGLPGVSNLSVNELLSGDQNEDWQVYWDNVAASDYLVEYDGSSKFKFSVGKAFWLINKGSFSVNTSVPTASLNNSYEVEIPLHTGWNLITNPLLSSISWSVIKNANSISEPIWSYSGNFNQAVSFVPYKGYYYFNSTNLTKLKVHYKSGTLGKPVVENIYPNGWRVNITLISGDFIDKSTWFGISSDAKTQQDQFDYHKPHGIGDFPNIVFYRPNWDTEYSNFASDIRPAIDEIELWNFEVICIPEQAVNLQFVGIDDIPPELDVLLVDEANFKSIDLRNAGSYTMTSKLTKLSFTVAVGRPENVEDYRESLIPKTFSLGKNFPNPFNLITTIPVNIPEEMQLSVVIYDLLGQNINILCNNSPAKPGRYFFTWNGYNNNGKPVPTGIYFIKVSTNTGITCIDKMILVK